MRPHDGTYLGYRGETPDTGAACVLGTDRVSSDRPAANELALPVPREKP